MSRDQENNENRVLGREAARPSEEKGDGGEIG